jgi:hypothetical protein
MYIMLSQEIIISGAGAASYAAGIVADQLAIRKAGANRANLAEFGGPDFEAADTAVSIGRIGSAKRVGLAAISMVAIGSGAAGSLLTYGAFPGETQQEQFAPLITVADRTGSTKFGDGEVKPFQHINDIAAGVYDHVKSNNILLAISSRAETVTKDELISNDPKYNAFGPSSAMTLATSTALDSAKNHGNGTAMTRGSNVLIVTNGNVIGDTDTIISTAKANEAAIFIVNTEGDKADPATIVSLRAISEQTGAQYWSGTTTNVDEIAKVVNNTYKTAETKTDKPLRSPALVLGGLLVVGVANIVSRTKNLTFQRGFKGE